MISKIYSIVLHGLDAELVEVEVGVLRGLPKFFIVGLGDTAIQEARERVRNAIKKNDYLFPPYRITVNLAPADVKKEGPIYDLAIALGILGCGGLFEIEKLKDSLVLGELSLEGKLRPINGAITATLFAKQNGFKKIFLPEENALEANIIDDVEIYPVQNLKQIVDHLIGVKQINPFLEKPKLDCDSEFGSDMKNILGHFQAKRVLEIAAAGGHNVLFSGPPGSGKTLLAKTFMSILPGLSLEESIEVSKIYSVSGKLNKNNPLISKRPFRLAHHTASAVSIIGGGTNPSPGEISLAHKGVLFLDELPEFPVKVLETLRQPLEDKVIHISRARKSVEYPCDFMLIATMNPCPCGFFGDKEKECRCSQSNIFKYQNKISGPLLDRIDMFLDIPRISVKKLIDYKDKGESSKEIKKRVENARKIQKIRYMGQARINGSLSNKDMEKYCLLDNESKELICKAEQVFNLSGRSTHKIIKLARTIADLENSENIRLNHVSEALSYRKKA